MSISKSSKSDTLKNLQQFADAAKNAGDNIQKSLDRYEAERLEVVKRREARESESTDNEEETP